jgi:Ca2+-binding EF-hand superfamily protein
MVSGISGYGNSYDAASIYQMRQNFFNKIDQNGDGSIDKTELTSIVSNNTNGVSVDDIFSKLDTDGDGVISKDEFEAAQKKMEEDMKQNGPPPMGMMGAMGKSPEDLFASIDENGDGSLDATELKASAPANGPSTDDMLSKLDTNKDGVISKDEFLADAPKPPEEQQDSSNTDQTADALSDDADLKNRLTEMLLSMYRVLSDASGTSSTTAAKYGQIDTTG